MSTPTAPPPSSLPSAPAGPRETPAQPGDAHGGADLDPEEDVAPNLGGEDQMQDA